MSFNPQLYALLRDKIESLESSFSYSAFIDAGEQPRLISDQYPLPVTLVEGTSGSRIQQVVSTFTVKTAFTGASIGDTLLSILSIDLIDAQNTLQSWYNLSTNLTIATVSLSNLESLATTALTDGQLRASPIQVSIVRPQVTPIITSIDASITTSILVASNANRKSLILHNASNSAKLRFKFGSNASLTDYSEVLNAGDSFYLSEFLYTGVISGIWEAAIGSVKVTELV